MRNRLTLMAIAIALLCPLGAYSQNTAHAFELGLGGSAFNHTRTMVSDFHQTKGGDYVFTLEEKLLYGGAELYSAYEIHPWLYADLRGTVGLARYYKAGSQKQGLSFMAGPGIQLRPLVGSEWVQPFLRLGVNYYHKNFPTAYFGTFEGDVTKEAVWKAEDSWNKGYTFDADSFFPVAFGVGIVGWLSDWIGVRIEGDYLRAFGSKGGNFAQGTAGLVLRLGGRSKKTAVPGPERVVERVVEKEIVKEVPVEKVREVVREVEVETDLSMLMDNVTFDFDKADLRPESEAIMDEVARIILKHPEEKFLICGHTDAKGSNEYNDRLSTQRAMTVYGALLSRGVPEAVLCYRGLGKRGAFVPGSADDSIRRGDRKVVIERVSWEPLWNHLKKQQQSKYLSK